MTGFTIEKRCHADLRNSIAGCGKTPVYSGLRARTQIINADHTQGPEPRTLSQEGFCSILLVDLLVDIPEETRITAKMSMVKRRVLGIPPSQEPLVMGRVAKRDIRADEWITWEMS